MTETTTCRQYQPGTTAARFLPYRPACQEAGGHQDPPVDTRPAGWVLGQGYAITGTVHVVSTMKDGKVSVRFLCQDHCPVCRVQNAEPYEH